jgi:alkylation response protein AidB-like acyl-CoA dehydrogenase
MTQAPTLPAPSAFVPFDPARVRPARSVAELRERAARLLPEIAAGAAVRERDRVMPYEWVRRIADEGLYSFRVPERFGGAGGTVRDVIRFVIDVAAVDSNVAQSLRPGFGFIESLLWADDVDVFARWLPRVQAGEIFGNAGWERGGPSGEITARLTRDGDAYRVSGTKYYSTGALYADWVGSFALDDHGKEVSFVVPRDRPGLQLVDDFDAMGQRLTASGTTIFDRVEVRPDEIRPPMARDRRTPIPALYQLFLAAVEAGIAKNAFGDAVHFTQHFARPIKHSSATRSVDDPYVQESVGEIAANAYAADAVVIKAAEALDAAWSGGLTPELLTTAAIEVAQAQFFAVQAALKAGELLFDVGGASTTSRDHNLDRHWRNARTVANHNPRQWKAAVVGNYHLTGAQPPTTGLF